MKLTVEMFGLARRLTQEKAVEIEVNEGATLRDVATALTNRYPVLIGQVFAPQTNEFVAPYFFVIDGKRPAQSLDIQIQEGQKLVLMFQEAGG